MSIDNGLISLELENKIETKSVHRFVARLFRLGWVSNSSPAKGVWKIGNVDHSDEIFEHLNLQDLASIMEEKVKRSEPIFFYASFPGSDAITSIHINANSITFDLDDVSLENEDGIGRLDQVINHIQSLCFPILGPFTVSFSRYVDR